MGKMVYTCFCTDVIHEGHMNILKRASEYGDVYVGVLSDEAMVGFNRFPTISLEQRMEIVRQTGACQRGFNPARRDVRSNFDGDEAGLCGARR